MLEWKVSCLLTVTWLGKLEIRFSENAVKLYRVHILHNYYRLLLACHESTAYVGNWLDGLHQYKKQVGSGN